MNHYFILYHLQRLLTIGIARYNAGHAVSLESLHLLEQRLERMQRESITL